MVTVTELVRTTTPGVAFLRVVYEHADVCILLLLGPVREILNSVAF